jgi:hypothetical protein
MLFRCALRKRRRRGAIARLVAFLLQVINDVPATRGFDEANPHSRAGNEFLRVGQPLIEIFRSPDQASARQTPGSTCSLGRAWQEYRDACSLHETTRLPGEARAHCSAAQ